ncbi:MAG: hypothetical protein ACM3X3_07075 [Betaproteobacteria bacterium]
MAHRYFTTDEADLHPADVPARPVEAVLARLQGVRRTGEGRWLARCPAHNDTHPSLSVREASDGKVLLRCWAGCDSGQVLAALGLSWRDLFPDGARGRSKAATVAERKAAARAQAEAELRRRLDAACDGLDERLSLYVRAIHLALDGADLATFERLADWVHALPWLEYLLDGLQSEDLETRLWAAREARTWLLT